MEYIKRAWGIEEVIVNNASYCAKYLHLQPGMKCSLHCHPIKKETFLLDTGGPVKLEVGDRVYMLYGTEEPITIEPGTYHRFSLASCFAEAKILEISTPHSDDDVVRLEPSGPIQL